MCWAASAYHERLWHIRLAIQYSSLPKQDINQTGILLRRTVVQICNEAKGCVGAADLKGILEADGEPVEGPGQLSLLAERV